MQIRRRCADCFRGKVYTGPKDPILEADDLWEKDWTTIRAKSFYEFKENASVLASARARRHDKVLMDVINNVPQDNYYIPLGRTNKITESGIDYGTWLII